MIKLLPTTEVQTIAIIPRNYVFSEGVISVLITEEGTNKQETISPLNAEVIENFVVVDFHSTILREEYTYYLQFSLGGKRWFYDKAYVTSSTNKEETHTINKNEYVQTPTINEYIIL